MIILTAGIIITYTIRRLVFKKVLQENLRHFKKELRDNLMVAKKNLTTGPDLDKQKLQKDVAILEENLEDLEEITKKLN